MSSKHKKKFIGAVLVIILSSVAIFLFQISKDKSILVETDKSKLGVLQKTIEISGILEAVNTFQIVLPQNQKVSKVFVSEGQSISKNQILAIFDKEDLQIQLEKLRIQQAIQENDLQELFLKRDASEKIDLKNAVSLSFSKMEASKQKLEEGKRVLLEKQDLYADSRLPYEEFIQFQLQLTDLENIYLQDKASYESARNKELDYDQNLNRSIFDKEKQTEITKLEISQLENQMEDLTIKSDIDGILVEFELLENRQVTATNQTIQIIDKSSFHLVSQVLQEDAVKIQEGQEATILLKNAGKEYTGYVSKIKEFAASNDANAKQLPKQRVEISILNPDTKLTQGFEAEALVVVEKTDAILYTKKAGLRKNETGASFLYLFRDGRAKKQIVKTGFETDYEIEILEGLVPDEAYILNPPEKLKDEAAVKIPSTPSG
jgi:HlyD family secretion protein